MTLFLSHGLVDVISAGETRASEVGKRVVLPRSFPGGDRDMQKKVSKCYGYCPALR